MKTHWYKNIKFRITLGFSSVFIVFVFAGNFLVYHKISDQLTRSDNAYLLTRAQTLLDKTEAYPSVIPLPGRGENMMIVLQEHDRVTEIFRSPSLSKIRQPVTNGINEADTFRMATVSRSLDNSDAFIRLTLLRSRGPLDHDRQTLWLHLFLISLLAVLFSAVAAYFIAVFLLRPIRSIIQSAKQIQSQNEPGRLPVPGTADEVNELAVTLNLMLARIEESARQQNAFFTSASHELKTPLAIMQAELEAASRNPPSDVSTMVNAQLDELGRMQRLVQEFLWAGQLRAGKLSLHTKLCRPDDVLFLQLKKMQRLIQSASLAIEVKMTADELLPEIKCDEDKLLMVFANLIDNAIKHSAEPRQLKIGIEKTADALVFTLSNPVSHDSSIPGTEAFAGKEHGLGLWLSRHIIALHRGILHAQNKHGQFIVTLTLSTVF